MSSSVTRPWSRRALLRTGAAALGGFAGCVGGRDDDSNTPTSTAATSTTTEEGAREGTKTGTPDSTTKRPPTETTRQRAVELVPAGVQSSFFYRRTPRSLDVGAVEGRQFAFVTVRPRTGSPPPSNFALVADDHHFWGSLAPGDVGGPTRLVERGRSYQYEEADPGWVAFEVPNPLDAEAVVLTHDGRKHPVGEDFLAALRAPPADFELLGVEMSDRVAPDESFEVAVRVKNVGATSGIFRACLDVVESTRPPRRSAFAVPAGEQREWAWTLDAPTGNQDSTSSASQHGTTSASQNGTTSASQESIHVRFRSAVADRVTAVTVDSATIDEE